MNIYELVSKGCSFFFSNSMCRLENEKFELMNLVENFWMKCSSVVYSEVVAIAFTFVEDLNKQSKLKPQAS